MKQYFFYFMKYLHLPFVNFNADIFLNIAINVYNMMVLKENI